MPIDEFTRSLHKAMLGVALDTIKEEMTKLISDKYYEEKDLDCAIEALVKMKEQHQEERH